MFMADSILRVIKQLMSSVPYSVGRNESKLLKHFRQKAEFRSQLVEDIVHGVTAPRQTLTALELVAICSLRWDEPLDEFIQMLPHYSDHSLSPQFTDEFFFTLVQTIHEFYVKGFNREATSLMKFGEAAARHQNNKEWETRFHEYNDACIKGYIQSIPIFRSHP